MEVEAKLGVLKYKDGNHRLNHPVRVETSKYFNSFQVKKSTYIKFSQSYSEMIAVLNLIY